MGAAPGPPPASPPQTLRVLSGWQGDSAVPILLSTPRALSRLPLPYLGLSHWKEKEKLFPFGLALGRVGPAPPLRGGPPLRHTCNLQPHPLPSQAPPPGPTQPEKSWCFQACGLTGKEPKGSEGRPGRPRGNRDRGVCKRGTPTPAGS